MITCNTQVRVFNLTVVETVDDRFGISHKMEADIDDEDAGRDVWCRFLPYGHNTYRLKTLGSYGEDHAHFYFPGEENINIDDIIYVINDKYIVRSSVFRDFVDFTKVNAKLLRSVER